MDTDFVRFVCDSFFETNILRSPGEVNVSKRVRVWTQTSRGLCPIHFARQTNILRSPGEVKCEQKG